jgi:Tol biopolymer transport system component/DNA-binding winged helix-turn-helix (wHTH) protein
VREDFRLGEWLVQPKLVRLSKPDRALHVRAKVMDLLVYLAQHHGEVVSKDDLLRDVWGTEDVSESALTRTVAELRQAFGDDVNEPSILQTIPKRGYRLIAPIVVDVGTDPNPGGQQALRSAHVRRGAWATLGIAALVLFGTAWIAMTRDVPAARAPTSRPVTSLDGVESDPALSFDGSQIAFIWRNALYVKPIDSGQPRKVADNVFGTAWSPDGQWIATYRLTDKPAYHDLLLVSPSGGEERVLRRSLQNVSYRSLDWSPTNEWIAVTHKERPEEATGVFLVSLSGELKRLTTPGIFPDSDPHFSNDGSRLVFFRASNVGEEGPFEIASVGVDGTGLTTIRSLEGLPLGVDWTPNDKALVLSMQRSDSLSRLWHVPLDKTPLKPLEVSEGAWRFTISGRRLAYAQYARNDALWWAPGPAYIGTDIARPFLAQGRGDRGPRFSPDGRRIAFMSNRSGADQIWVCEADGTKCRPLTHTGICRAPSWSPNSKSIVYINAKGHDDVYIVGVDDGVPHALTRDPAPDGVPGFSGDGIWVYFSSKRDTMWRMWRVLADGTGIPEVVPTPNGGEVRASSDGWLYFTNLWAGSISRMRPDGSDRKFLDQGLPNPVGWTLWRDRPVVRIDDTIFRVDPLTGQRTLIRRLDVPAAGRHTTPTTTMRLYASCTGFDISPDGRSIVYCAANPQGDIILVDNFR